MSHLNTSSSKAAIKNCGTLIPPIAGRERHKPEAKIEQNHHEGSEIQCTEMGNVGMNPEQRIVNTDFVKGFKVVSTRPALSDAEYEEKEQKIVEDIVKSLSANECARPAHKAKASQAGGNGAGVE